MPLAYDPTHDALLRPELRDTVFSSHPQPGPIAVAVEAARLAYYRFEESEAEKARLGRALTCFIRSAKYRESSLKCL